MIRSMTGYGAAEGETAAGRLRVEIRTVNHDSFRASLRLPTSLEAHEVPIRDRLRAVLPRGHVSCSVRLERLEEETPAATGIRLDEIRARAYMDALVELRDRLELPGEIDLAMIARYGDIITRDDVEAPAIELEDLDPILAAATLAVVEMRVSEGRRLVDDFEARLAALESALATIADRAPGRLLTERDRLRAAVAELAGDIEVDEERLAREIAYLAERWDISEEIVRLRSHIELFRETLAADDATPVGKRLRFISQEMLREANTIGSKANDVTIQHQVVELKNEIDRVREQIENVE